MEAEEAIRTMGVIKSPIKRKARMVHLVATAREDMVGQDHLMVVPAHLQAMID